MGKLKNAIVMGALAASTWLAPQHADAQQTAPQKDGRFHSFGIGYQYSSPNGLYTNGNSFIVEGVTTPFKGWFGSLFRLNAAFVTGNKKMSFAQQFVTNNPWTGPLYMNNAASWRPNIARGGIEVGPCFNNIGGSGVTLMAGVEGRVSAYPGFSQNWLNMCSPGYGVRVRAFLGSSATSKKSAMGFEAFVWGGKDIYNPNYFNSLFGTQFGPNVNHNNKFAIEAGVKITLGNRTPHALNQ